MGDAFAEPRVASNSSSRCLLGIVMGASVGAPPQSKCRAFVVASILIKHSTNWWLDSHRATRELCIGVFGARVVPSRPLAQDDSFALEEVTALATGFEGALRTLG